MELKGAKELEAALLALPKRVRKAAIRRALIKSAMPIAQHARALVKANSTRTGRLERVINVATTLSRRQRRSRARGADRKAVEVFLGAGPARQAHLIEFGTGPRVHKDGSSTGAVRAEPFMRPAWEGGKMKALEDFGRMLWDEIARSAKQVAARALRAAKR
jgi:HK97 gp10 family phage protein